MLNGNMKKENAIIVDIDGTIAENSHRVHHIKKDPKNPRAWEHFFKECIKDEMVPETILVAYRLALDHKIILCTGRTETYRPETKEWLDIYFPFYTELHMRRDGDYRPDFEAKGDMVDLVLKKYNVVMAFDDKDSVIKMLTEKGIYTFQVKGDEE